MKTIKGEMIICLITSAVLIAVTSVAVYHAYKQENPDY